MRIISFSALPLAVLASAALADELTDARMDQISGGGLFELTADELDSATSAPRRNVIGGVGMMLEALLYETFSSPQALLQDVISTSGTTLRSIGDGQGHSPGNVSISQGNVSISQGNVSISQGNVSISQGNVRISQGNVALLR